MKNLITATVATLLATFNLTAATRYVDAYSANPTAPYTNWVTAATNIQDAVNSATSGDEIVVTNGVYAPIRVEKPLLLRSTSGPQVTVIDAARLGRCAWLTNGASMTGFWLANGQADYGAGVFCAASDVFLTNCMILYNSAYNPTDPNIGQGGGVCGGTLYNCLVNGNTAAAGGGGAVSNTLYGCTLAGNYSSSSSGGGGGGALYSHLYNCLLTRNNAFTGTGGGAYEGAFSNCTVIGNSAAYGGGLYASGLSNCIANQCVIVGNSASADGGGVYTVGAPFLTNCVIGGNSAGRGGGTYGPALYNCTVTNNTASGAYGGVYVEDFGLDGYYNCIVAGNHAASIGGGYGYFYNCLIAGNSATGQVGGAAYYFWNCTIVSNSAGASLGGVSFGSLTNSIVYFNTPDNGTFGNCSYSCTTPRPAGVGNITNAPQFVNPVAGDFRLLGTSPCLNAGNNALAVGSTDLAGNARIVGAAVDMGAYEFPGTNPPAFYAWLGANGVTADGTTDDQDADADGLNNWREWVCGTCPTNPASALRLLSATPAGAHVLVTWQSVTGINYIVERSTNLAASPHFTRVATNCPGLAGTTLYTDTNAASAGPRFYRVGVMPQ